MKIIRLKNLCWILFLWLGLGLWAGQAPAAERGPKQFTRNQQNALYEAQVALSEKNDPGRATAILSRFLKRHPKEEHHLIHYTLGLAYYRLKKFGKAKGAFLQSLKIAPDHRSSCLNLAAVHYTLKEFRQAAELWERAFALSPEQEPELLYQAGAAFYEAGEFAASARVLRNLIQSAPQPKKSWLELYIHVLMELGKTEVAEKIITEFLKEHPEEEGYWRLLAQLLLDRKKYRGAVAALEVAYRLRPPKARAWKQLASIYFHLDSPLAGIRTLQRAYEPRSGPEQSDELARWQERAGRTDLALVEIDRAIKAQPTARRYLVKGRLLYEHGRYEDARQSLVRAVELDPKLFTAHLLLGYAALELGLKKTAREAFGHAAGSDKLNARAKAALAALDQEKKDNLSGRGP